MVPEGLVDDDVVLVHDADAVHAVSILGIETWTGVLDAGTGY